MDFLNTTASHIINSVSNAATEPTTIQTNSDAGRDDMPIIDSAPMAKSGSPIINSVSHAATKLTTIQTNSDAGRDDMPTIDPAPIAKSRSRSSSPRSRSSSQRSRSSSQGPKSPLNLHGAIGKSSRRGSGKKTHSPAHKWTNQLELLQKFKKIAAEMGGAPIELIAWALGPNPTAEDAFAPEAAYGSPAAIAQYNTVMTLMEQIYQDIDVCSAPEFIDSTSDLMESFGGEPGAATHDQSSTRLNLEFQTREMFRVIESAVNQTRDQSDTIGSNESTSSERYASFAAEHGWMMLSILATSTAFRVAAGTFDDRLWVSFNITVFLNKNSIEYFAKIRGLNWTLALTRKPEYAAYTTDLREGYPGLEPDHPHTYVVPRESNPVRRPQFKGKVQKNIVHNRFDPLSYRPSARRGKLRRDPTIEKGRKCHICQKKSCRCDPSSCLGVLRPLVELAASGNDVGVGIRVLQPIPKGQLLAEYVGNIVPSTGSGAVDDTTYLCRSNTNASVDAQEHGNWTRFINHSCDAHAEIACVVIGQRRRCMIRLIKDIAMFEELTLDYGDLYWASRAGLCRCGSTNCRFATVEKRDARAVALGVEPVGE